jgi:hypothetical protein
MRHHPGLIAAGACLTLAIAGSAFAQPQPATGRLHVTVVDPSGAVIPQATVTVTAQDARSAQMPLAPVKTSDAGVAVVDNLAPGRYTIVAEFAGFETVTVRDHRVRAGDSRRAVTLPIKKVSEDIIVGRDGQSSSLDPRGNAFSTVLTREQIAVLPDDPDELEAVLRAMSPPGSTIRVDGFTGGRLPPKSQIRSVRLPRMDMFAAQNHGGLQGMHFIDIMTQPGNGPLRGSVDATFRDDALNARNPFTPAKGDEGVRQGGGSLSGTIVPNRSSFSISLQQGHLFNSGSVLAERPNGRIAEPVRQPTERSWLNARFDQAISPDHVLRFSLQRTSLTNRNLGVGGFDLTERAYTSESNDTILRISENGPVGRRFFSESRLQLRWTSSQADSALEAPTIRVLDAFTSGGAQRSGGSDAWQVEAATDLDYVRGAHAFRAGVLLEGGRYRADDVSNYLGTYTFASLADYEAGRAANYTRRIGDPRVRYSNVQFGAYAQDDYRLARSVLLSYGVRYEAQTVTGDQNNVSPRVTLTWSPRKSGRTTVRSGFGRFTDWIGTSTYEQSLRFDGFRQQELNVVNPAFPDPGFGGITLPSNRYLLGDHLTLPESMAMNLGVDQQIASAWRASATYTYRPGSRLPRGRNLNAPVGGVRPDGRFSNVVEAVGDAESRSHTLSTSLSFVKLDWKQAFLAMNYSLAASETNTTGPFALPANGDELATEWGPSSPRHRAGATFNMRPFSTFGVAVNVRAQSGTPYNITTGTDDNADGLFNDRPDGTPRNSARTAAQWDAGLRLSYTIAFGPHAAGAGAGTPTVIMMGGGGGGMPTGMGSAAGDRRFRLELYASAQNVTNRRNYIGYSGVLSSPFFGQPTNVLNPRKVEIGARFMF